MATLSTSDIGARFKTAREKISLTIDQVHTKTRIHSTVLTAIEEGRCDEMLTPNYVRSFLKEYSKFLGLDSDEILREYSIIHPEAASDKITLNRLQAKQTFDISVLFRAARLVIILIASLSLIVFLSGKAIRFFKTARRTARPGAVSESQKKTRPAKSGSALWPFGIFDRGKNDPVPESVKDAGTAKSQSSISQAAIPNTTPLNLVLKVKHPVLVGVKKDGIVLFKRVLPKGSKETFVADKSITLYIARAEAVKLTLNDKPLQIPAKGVIRDLQITRKGIKIK